MGAKSAKLHKEVRVNLQASLRRRVQLHHPTAKAIRVELLVPGRIERVCEIDALTVTAHLDHLRSAVERRLGLLRVRGFSHNSSQVHRPCKLRVEGVRDIVLPEFSRAPT